jgi:hypothetical protein
MAGTVTHFAIADKIYETLGGKITDYPLFLGGNIAPDAVHARKGFERDDKKRSHFCEGVRSYGYGYPEMAELFWGRVDAFIDDYVIPAEKDRDLYLGYLVHILTDEYFLMSVYKLLEGILSLSGRELADRVNNREYSGYFRNAYDLRVSEYPFARPLLADLEAVWDYEVRDYVTADEINVSKRWVIKNFVDGGRADGAGVESRSGQEVRPIGDSLKFVSDASEAVICRINRII